MKRYSEYKDSGVKWIGEIPGHWDTPRIKSVAIFNPSKSTVNYQKVGYAPMDCIRCGNITAGIIDYKKLPTGLTYFENEDIVVAKVTPCFENGNIAIAKNLHNGCAYGSSELFVFRCYGVENRYLFYYMQDEKFKHKCCSTMTGTGGLKRISSSFIRNAFIPLPPLPEQEAIVTYLDTKVAKIDEYISIAEKKIAALEELKQTIIAEAVTRGIHKDVLMKDSGVKWIGMIPEHWKVMRLSQIAYEHFISNKKIHHQNLLSLSYGQIIRKDINGTNGLLPASFDTYQVVEEGNIILRLTDLQNDHKSLRVGLVKETGIITSAYLCLAPKNMVYSKFLYFQLHACDIKKVFYSMGDGLRQSLNYDGMRKLASVIPPLPEQQEIVTYIEAKVAKIDQLCQAERSQIEKLKEYKQRLISDVVTGKVKVTND